MVVTGISGQYISAASAAYAPTNSSDVSAIASAYQVVSATAGDGGYITSINGSGLSGAGGGGGASIGTGEFLGYSIVSSEDVVIAGESAQLQSSVITPYTDTVWSTNTISANANRIQFRIYNFSTTAGNMTSLPVSQTVRFNVTAVDAGQNLYDNDELALIVYTGTNSASPVAKWNIGSISNNKTATWNNTVTWNSTSQPNLLLTAYNSQLYNLTTTARYSAAGTGGITSESSLNVQILAASPSDVSSIASSYAEAAVSSASSNYYPTGNPSGFVPESAISAESAVWNSASAVSSKQDTLTFGYDAGNNISSIDGSAIGGQGGVDSATVSSIASSYAESAASSKLDSTAFNSGEFYSTSNPSGFITGVDLSNYATTGYVDSSVSGKLDSTAFNSGDFYTTANESGYVGSAYVDSAVSGKMDTSGMTSYALSADVSGTVDLVTSQSANWGGSALALSAGPGVKLEKVGDTLVASTDETVLWSGNITASNGTGTLAYPPSAFADLKIEWYGENTGEYGLKCSYFHNDGLNFSGLACGGIGQVYDNYAMGHHFGYLTLTNSTVTLVRQCRYNLTTTGLGAFESGNGMFRVQRIIGINRTAEA